MENVAEKLYNILGTKFDNTDIKTLDSTGKETTDMEEIEMFSFDFLVNSRNYGPVVILLSAKDNLEVYYGDNTSKSLDPDAKKKWENLIEHLSTYARSNRLGFSLKHTSDLKYDLSNITDITESYRNIFEGYYGTSKTSYSPQGKAKIIIKHTRALGEDEKRFRNISSLFIENASGERFKLPFTKLTGARAMARHVTEGGNPYDLFGIHICEMVKDINTLGGFVRRSKMYEGNDEAMALVETGRTHYTSLRKGLKQIAGKRGYSTYKEGWEPSEITEMDTDTSAIRKLFTEKTVNTRTEEALPLLARLQKMAEAQIEWPEEVKGKQFPGDTHPEQGDWEDDDDDEMPYPGRDDDMNEIKEFEEWADNIVEGTWAVPETPKQVKALRAFLSTEQPLGLDAMNASDALYNIIGDDDLFDALSEVAESDPDADARPIVINWIREAIRNKLEFSNPNVMQNLKMAIKGVQEGLESELDADDETHLHASVNRDVDAYIRKESNDEDINMKPFTEYVAETEAEVEEAIDEAVEEVDEAVEEVDEAEEKEEVTESGMPLHVAMDNQTDLKDLMQRTNFLLKK